MFWCYSSGLNRVVCEMCRCGVEGGFGSCAFEEKSARGGAWRDVTGEICSAPSLFTEALRESE